MLYFIRIIIHYLTEKEIRTNSKEKRFLKEWFSCNNQNKNVAFLSLKFNRYFGIQIVKYNKQGATLSTSLGSFSVAYKEKRLEESGGTYGKNIKKLFCERENSLKIKRNKYRGKYRTDCINDLSNMVRNYPHRERNSS